MSDAEMEQKFRALEERCTELESRLSMLEGDLLLEDYEEGDLEGVLDDENDYGLPGMQEDRGLVQEEDLV